MQLNVSIQKRERKVAVHVLKVAVSKKTSFKLMPEYLSLVNETTGKYYQPTVKVQISMSGGQPSVKNITTSKVLSSTIQFFKRSLFNDKP